MINLPNRLLLEIWSIFFLLFFAKLIIFLFFCAIESLLITNNATHSMNIQIEVMIFENHVCNMQNKRYIYIFLKRFFLPLLLIKHFNIFLTDYYVKYLIFYNLIKNDLIIRDRNDTWTRLISLILSLIGKKHTHLISR